MCLLPVPLHFRDVGGWLRASCSSAWRHCCLANSAKRSPSDCIPFDISIDRVIGSTKAG